jgi:hypothetical protein
VGDFVGRFVGALVGDRVGFFVGNLVGDRVGALLGLPVGTLVGLLVGLLAGALVGVRDGLLVGAFVGVRDGLFVGDFVGVRDGVFVGTLVGMRVGERVGDLLGCLVGDLVGALVGAVWMRGTPGQPGEHGTRYCFITMFLLSGPHSTGSAYGATALKQSSCAKIVTFAQPLVHMALKSAPAIAPPAAARYRLHWAPRLMSWNLTATRSRAVSDHS